MLVEERAGSVLYRSEYNHYFRTDSKLFPAAEFLLEVLRCIQADPARAVSLLRDHFARAATLWKSNGEGFPEK